MNARGGRHSSSSGLLRGARSGSHGVADRERRGIRYAGKKTAHCDPDPAAIDLREDRSKALALFDVPSPAVARLDRFVDLLLTWQGRINLIAPSTIPSLWTRHVADSLQLLDLVEAPYARPRVWLDLGSGGGFPGIVLACALADVTGTQVHLVESNLKKAAFLREAIRETSVPGIVHAVRIESLAAALGAITIDCVTARALAPLSDLMGMIAPFIKKGAKALLLKGQDLDHELTESTKRWHIEAETVPSRTSKTGRILLVHALSQQAGILPAESSLPASTGEGDQGGCSGEREASSRQKP
jgi:16S rRNA (guanine527-N7)-methyltransferase